MSIDILKMLIESACSEGSISNEDKTLLSKKAIDLGINQTELDSMIEISLKGESLDDIKSEATSSTDLKDESSGFITSDTEVEETQSEISSGFISSGHETSDNSTKKVTPPPLDTTIKSHFKDVSTLDAQGAMSLVQKGKLHGKWVIIKRVKPEYQNNSKYKELFYKEFENAYHLDHPNIVRLLDKGQDGEGPYYSMEFIDGQPLTKLIGNRGIKNDRLIKRIFSQTIDALSYVHKKQIFHRDLKPDNILVTYKGDNVKILDFGLAAADSFDDDLIKVGTPKYAAPEQKRKGNTVDQRADIYSLGLIFLEMLTGSISNNDRNKIENANYLHIVEKCTKQNPNERFYDCIDILEWLNKPFARVEKKVTPPPPLPPPVDKKLEQEKKEIAQLKDLFANANMAFNKKDYKKAQQLYKNYLSKKPNDALAKKQLAKCNDLLKPKQETKNDNEAKKNKLLVPGIIGAVVIILIVLTFVFKDNIFGDNSSNNITDNNTTEENNNSKYNDYKKKADDLFKNEDFASSKDYYDSALVAKPNDDYAKKRKKECDDKMNNFLALKKKADDFYKNKNAVKALELYEQVLKINPDEEESKVKAEKCKSIIDKAKNIKPDEGPDGKFGFVDSDGWLVVDYQFDEAKNFKDKLSVVKKDEKFAFVDKKGKRRTKFIFDRVIGFSPGYKAYNDSDGSKYLININSGKFVMKKF